MVGSLGARLHLAVRAVGRGSWSCWAAAASSPPAIAHESIAWLAIDLPCSQGTELP